MNSIKKIALTILAVSALYNVPTQAWRGGGAGFGVGLATGAIVGGSIAAANSRPYNDGYYNRRNERELQRKDDELYQKERELQRLKEERNIN